MRDSAVKLVRLFQLLKKFPLYHWTWMFIFLFMWARLRSLSWADEFSWHHFSLFLQIDSNIFLPSMPGSLHFCAHFWSLSWATCPTNFILQIVFRLHTVCSSPLLLPLSSPNALPETPFRVLKLNGGKHSQYSVYSLLPVQCSFYLLLSFTKVFELCTFLKTVLAIFLSRFCQYSGKETLMYTYFSLYFHFWTNFHAFNRASVFPLWYFYFCPVTSA
jgi:hypothetical protein